MSVSPSPPAVSIRAIAGNYFDGSQVNVINNPRFEAGCRIVQIMPPTGLTLDLIASSLTGVRDDVAIEGDFSLQVAAGDLVVTQILPAAPLEWLSFSATALPAPAAAIIGIEFYDQFGVSTGPAVEQAVATGQPQTIAISDQAPVNSLFAACYARAEGVGVAIFDQCLATPTPNIFPFFDGDTGGCQWDGQRFFSASSRLGTAIDLGFMTQLAAPIWSSDSPLAGVISS